MWNTVKNFIKNNKQVLYLLYLPVFLLGFVLLEIYHAPSYIVVHCAIDDWIPFTEAFIIPYLLWFPYLLGGVALLLILSIRHREAKKDFSRLGFYLICGLTICLAAYVIWPSMLTLRPDPYPRDNIFIDLCRLIQGIDAPTNVCPSMHVYTSCVMLYCIWGCGYIRTSFSRRTAGLLRYGSLVLTFFIVLSTMFVKQHSVIDVGLGILLSLLLYYPSVKFGNTFN